MIAIGITAVLLAVAVAWLGARFLIIHAARFGLVQVPLARSSHAVPTPRGGGIGLIAGASVGAVLVVPSVGSAALILPLSLAIAGVGLLDDLRQLPPKVRLAAQAVVVGLLLWLVIPYGLFGQDYPWLPLPVLLVALAIAGLWWINLFNFMDGIDGLAASEAVFVLLAGAGLALVGRPELIDAPLLWWLPVVAAGAIGFLMVNWAPARIFMGDAGSLGLGFLIFALALLTAALGWVPLSAWVILVALFVVDASVTLVRRLLARDRVFEAHRRHAYQFLARRFGSHRTVTLLYLAIDLVLLLPLALLAVVQPHWQWACAAAAYLPLIVGAVVVGAGRPEES